jgi:hypothetical protein
VAASVEDLAGGGGQEGEEEGGQLFGAASSSSSAKSAVGRVAVAFPKWKVANGGSDRVVNVTL